MNVPKEGKLRRAVWSPGRRRSVVAIALLGAALLPPRVSPPSPSLPLSALPVPLPHSRANRPAPLVEAPPRLRTCHLTYTRGGAIVTSRHVGPSLGVAHGRSDHRFWPPPVFATGRGHRSHMHTTTCVRVTCVGPHMTSQSRRPLPPLSSLSLPPPATWTPRARMRASFCE